MAKNGFNEEGEPIDNLKRFLESDTEKFVSDNLGEFEVSDQSKQ